MRFLRSPLLVLCAMVGLVFSGFAVAADESSLTKDQIREFLLHAVVIKSRPIGKGITRPFRLTLTDGAVTHDAAFQSVDERKSSAEFARGGMELNFRDSYHYNIAAYTLAELLELDHMMPVTVERKWNGRTGALSWWIPAKMDEGERLKRRVRPPDIEGWNKQMYRMRVFAQLVHDTDRNLGNVLIAEEAQAGSPTSSERSPSGSEGERPGAEPTRAVTWKLWMIDFTRAFRQWKQLESAGNLTRCDRTLLEKLRQLDAAQVRDKTRPHLSTWEVDAVMARRDLILEHFKALIAQKGEAVVLY